MGDFPAIEKDREERYCFLQLCPSRCGQPHASLEKCAEAYGAEGPGRGKSGCASLGAVVMSDWGEQGTMMTAAALAPLYLHNPVSRWELQRVILPE